MTDSIDERGRGDSKPPRKTALPSARESVGGGAAPTPPPPPAGRRQRRGRRARGKHRERRAKPTPARDLTSAQAPPSPVQPDLSAVEVEIDGATWTAQVLGRSAGGGVRGAAPLLLLGFSPVGSGHGTEGREAWVVSSTLASLSPEQLELAFARSTPRRLVGGR